MRSPPSPRSNPALHLLYLFFSPIFLLFLSWAESRPFSLSPRLLFSGCPLLSSPLLSSPFVLRVVVVVVGCWLLVAVKKKRKTKKNKRRRGERKKNHVAFLLHFLSFFLSFFLSALGSTPLWSSSSSPPPFAMQCDEVIWGLINNGFCSFKIKSVPPPLSTLPAFSPPVCLPALFCGSPVPSPLSLSLSLSLDMLSHPGYCWEFAADLLSPTWTEARNR